MTLDDILALPQLVDLGTIRVGDSDTRTLMNTLNGVVLCVRGGFTLEFAVVHTPMAIHGHTSVFPVAAISEADALKLYTAWVAQAKLHGLM